MVIRMVTKSVRRVPRTLPAGEFKAKCLQIMDRVAETGDAVVITKRGRPVARLVPIEAPPKTLAGFLAGKIEIDGDIIAPAGDVWNAFQ
jgi:prevent-host-death family protein